MAVKVQDPWLQKSWNHAVEEFVANLRRATDGSRAVPGLDWTVTDLGQHVACLPAYWRARHAEGGHFSPPEDFAAFSNKARAHITETELGELADLVEVEFAAFMAELRNGPATRWLYGVEVTPAQLSGLGLSELVVHGRDLSGVTHAAEPTLDRAEANLVVDAMMAISPVFVDPDKARAQPDGIYHLAFRGGDSFTWTKRGAELVIERGKPPRADAHLNCDPWIFLLSSLGRIGQVRAAIGGGTIAYGRRPWRFLGLGAIVADGV